MKADDKILGVMPVIGLGTWEMSGKGCVRSVDSALRMGYRHLDTAQIYGNEKEVGRGMKQSGVDRKEIFLVTKVATGNLTPSLIRSSTRESLERLDAGYIDLLLIHWPTEEMNLRDCLMTMLELKETGIVKYLGVSNFDPDMFLESIRTGDVLTNQVKFTPYHEEFDNLKVAITHDRIITAYSPLAKGRVVGDRLLSEIGSGYGKTASQVALRWLTQIKNVSVIPKASGEKRQQENLDIFDFELKGGEIEQISSLSRKQVYR
jgi:2,5-diketo-D-gluconate reductase B